METAEILAVISIIVSLGNLYLYYRFSSKSHKPAIKHIIENLPPYNSPEDKSTIRVKNVGTAQATINAIFMKFSWDNDLQLFLYDESDEPEEYTKRFLSPNEEITFRKRLPEPPHQKKDCFLIIKTDFDNTWDKEDKFELCS